jgi:hypothetical protein
MALKSVQQEGNAMKTLLAVLFALLVLSAAFAQEKMAPKKSDKPAAPAISKGATIKKALSAAPADIAKDAAVMQDGKEIRPGKNGWVCMAEPFVMCMDKQWQAWTEAYVNKKDPNINGVGVAYMLAGDKGASNTDPYATGPTPNNQWVVTPAHIMVLSPDTKQLDSLPTDPNNGGPWVMWKGTKYAHIMVPVASMSAAKTEPKK